MISDLRGSKLRFNIKKVLNVNITNTGITDVTQNLSMPSFDLEDAIIQCAHPNQSHFPPTTTHVVSVSIHNNNRAFFIKKHLFFYWKTQTSKVILSIGL